MINQELVQALLNHPQDFTVLYAQPVGQDEAGDVIYEIRVVESATINPNIPNAIILLGRAFEH